MTRKIIVLEGADKVGKSFIADELSKFLHIPIFKSPGPINLRADHRKIFKHEVNYLYHFLKQTHYSVIIDRLYLSELVYGRVFKRKISIVDIKHFDLVFSQMNYLNIIVYCSYNKLLNRFSKSDQENLKYFENWLVQKYFLNMYNENLIKANTIIYDNSGPFDMFKLTNLIWRKLEW